jgi:DNA-nicking Smr family endonuclease
MSRGRKLSPDESAIWKKVARTANPLPGRLERLMTSGANVAVPVERQPARDQKTEPPPVTDAMRKALAASFRDRPATTEKKERSDASRSPLHPIERPVHRKIARGRLPIDATIDLHGLGQADAHLRLRAFVARAYAEGLRHVLVITGKGASFGSEGALKRAVPHWLTQADFRPYVSGYEQAGRAHGGEGALYLRLKKRRPGP